MKSSIRNEIKAQIIRAGYTMQEVVDQLHDEYGWSDSVSNLSGKLQRESLRYREEMCIRDSLGVHLYSPAKIHIQPLAVGMVWIFQRLTGLGQNGLRGHQPYNGLGPALGHGVKNGPQRTGGDIGLAAAGGDVYKRQGHGCVLYAV